MLSSSCDGACAVFRRRLRFLPHRRPPPKQVRPGQIESVSAIAAPGKFGVADVSQDRQQPRFHRGTAIAVEMPQRPQIAFLYRILGVGGVPHQIARQREDIVEIAAARRRENAALCRARHEIDRHRHVPACPRWRRPPDAAADRASMPRVSRRRFYHDRAGHMRVERAEIGVAARRRKGE